jgi:UTP:GlnB (protein PII) uridylyltransferase
MKKIILTIVALASISLSYAQNSSDELEILRDLAAAERKALVSENMMFSEEESKIFWPIYDAYRAAAKDISTKSMEIIEKFAMSYESMDDATATALMNDYFKNQTDAIKLQNDYRLKMEKQLPAKLVMRYMQIENKMNAIIAYGMAAEVPLIIKE